MHLAAGLAIDGTLDMRQGTIEVMMEIKYLKSLILKPNMKSTAITVDNVKQNFAAESQRYSMPKIECYYFWVFPWEIAPVPLMELTLPRYTLCSINETSIKLSNDEEKLSFDIADIESCRCYTVAIGGRFTWARLIFPEETVFQKGQLRHNQLSIAAMNPLTASKSDSETRRMIDVINALRDNRIPDEYPNPYQRALIHAKRGDEFLEKEWDPTKPPPTYSKIYGWGDITPSLVIVFTMIMLLMLIAYSFSK